MIKSDTFNFRYTMPARSGSKWQQYDSLKNVKKITIV
jgi:hypothetical protein